MAPRVPEAFDQFVARAKDSLANGATEVRYGLHHFSHAIVVEPNGTFAVRRLEYSEEERLAYYEERGMFTPEAAEMISKPRSVVWTAATLDALLAIVQRNWPS
jgi:hypothetical protein